MKRLSQCMIVKNEEATIRRALSWGAGIADEQIVVDTGSADRTAEIAASMGAKVLSFPWCDDFSAAKNFAVSQAEGKWIALLDADEYMEPEDAGKLLSSLKKLSPDQTDGIMVHMMQADGKGGFCAGGSQVRIFPNRPDLRYRRRIHEQLVRADGRPLRVMDGTQNLTVFHTGYANEGELPAGKLERNLRLIRLELEEHPDDCEMLGYLGDTCYASGQLEQAEAAYRQAISQMPGQTAEGDQRSAMTFLNLMMLLQQRDGSETELLGLYEQAVSREELKKDGDFDYLLARWYLSKDRLEDALPYLRGTIEKLERFGMFNRAMNASVHLLEIYEQTAVCENHVGNLQEAVRLSTTVLQTEPWSMTALLVLMESFRDGGVTPAQADQFFDRIYDRTKLKSKIFLLRTVKRAGWEKLERRLRRQLSPDELACFDRSQENRS